MNGQLNLPKGSSGGRSPVVSRCLFSSAFPGLLIGLFEATRFWTAPRVIPLLVPDVGWVIWFLAPLADMIFFGLAGLVLGWLAGRIHGGKEVLAALGTANAVTFVALMLGWFHREIGMHPLSLSGEVVVPLTIFEPAFLVSLVVFAAVWHWLEPLAGRVLSALMKPLKWGLAGATVVSIAAIGVFIIWPPVSGPAAPQRLPRRAARRTSSLSRSIRCAQTIFRPMVTRVRQRPTWTASRAPACYLKTPRRSGNTSRIVTAGKSFTTGPPIPEKKIIWPRPLAIRPLWMDCVRT